MPDKKISIRKVGAAIAWLLVGSLVVVALVAAINRTNEATCASIKIAIRGEEKNRFIGKEDMLALIGAKSLKAFNGKAMSSLDLRGMENKINKNPWVLDADLYFNADRELEIIVTERHPIARVFTASGNSWYLDTAGKYLPLAPGKKPIALPVFTGLPEKLLKKRSGDSVLLTKLIAMVDLMNADPFWGAQVEQVVYTPQKTFEVIPLAGNHRILLGDGTDVVKKMNRVKFFYKQVINKTGLNYYQQIDASYANQIVARRADGISTSVDKNKVPYQYTAAPLQVSSTVSADHPSPPVLNEPAKQPKAVMPPIR